MPQFGQGKPNAGAFYDSDFATIDTVLASALLFGAQGKNDCQVVTVTMTRPNLAVAAYADMMVRFYHGGRSGGTPIGMPEKGLPGETSPAFTVPFDKKRDDGTPVYKKQVNSIIDTGDPVTLIRNYLQSQQDQNAFVVLAGPATNLAAALDSPNVKPVIAAKVKYLVVAGGAFPSGPAEPHIKANIAAARKLLAEWPTPIFFAGSEVGAALEFPGAGVDQQFKSAVPNHPVADAYRAYKPMPYNTPATAMAAALYAARPKETYFQLSGPGAVKVEDDGRTSFTASEKGTQQYLIVDPAQKEKITALYLELVSGGPVGGGRRPPPAQQAVPPPPKK